MASTLFHGVRLPAARIAAFARLDGVGIFALIAGSYTPLAWCLMRGRWRRWTLAIVWGVAAMATAVIATGRHFPPVWGTGLYLGMGWGALACYSEIAQVVSHRALLPIVGRRPLLQPGGGAQPAALARPLPGDLRGP